MPLGAVPLEASKPPLRDRPAVRERSVPRTLKAEHTKHSGNVAGMSSGTEDMADGVVTTLVLAKRGAIKLP